MVKLTGARLIMVAIEPQSYTLPIELEWDHIQL